MAVLAIGVATVIGFFQARPTPSPARVGPEPRAPNPLVLDIIKTRGPDHTIWSHLAQFPQRASGQDGWDFGGRAGYSCGFMEWVETTPSPHVAFKVVAESYDQGGGDPDDGLYSYVDTPRQGTGNEPCSEIGTVPGNSGDRVPASLEELSRSCFGNPECANTAPGQPDFAHGHVLQVWQAGVEVARITTPHGEAETYQGSNQIGPVTSWWFRGDQDGEIILWYFNPDTGDYGIVARLSVFAYDPNITFDDCVLNNPQGTPCPQAFPNQPGPTGPTA